MTDHPRSLTVEERLRKIGDALVVISAITVAIEERDGESRLNRALRHVATKAYDQVWHLERLPATVLNADAPDAARPGGVR